MSRVASRKTASLMSSLVGLINSGITICLTFLMRTVVLKEFGVEYVGLYSLLSQTVGILAGVDGGVSSALFIRMHKPIAEDNLGEIQKYYFLIRIVYRVRGILVFAIGMVVALFIPRIANTSIEMTIVISCYIAFLLLNALSYCFNYDYFMLETVQKRYIASAIVCVVNVVVSVINIFLVYQTHNYFLYIIITSLNQVISYSICKLVFRNIKKQYYKKLRFERKYFKDIIDLLGMSLHTFSNILITNSDTIMMSMLLTLVVTGFYSNYYLILTGVNTLAMQITLSIKDPFRNLVMTSSDKVAYLNIKRIVFLYVIIAGTMGATYSAMADFFVKIFWGNENIISNQLTVYLLAFSFFINIISSPIVDYYYCKEYYRKDRISPLIEIVINIVLSVVLAKLIGLNGIIIGTIVTYLYRLAHRSKVVYGSYSNLYFKEMLFLLIKGISVYILITILLRHVVQMLAHYQNIIWFLIWAFAIAIISFSMQYLVFRKENEMAYYKSFFMEIVYKIIKR